MAYQTRWAKYDLGSKLIDSTCHFLDVRKEVPLDVYRVRSAAAKSKTVRQVTQPSSASRASAVAGSQCPPLMSAPARRRRCSLCVRVCVCIHAGGGG